MVCRLSKRLRKRLKQASSLQWKSCSLGSQRWAEMFVGFIAWGGCASIPENGWFRQCRLMSDLMTFGLTDHSSLSQKIHPEDRGIRQHRPPLMSEIGSSNSSARNVTMHNQLVPKISDTSVTTTMWLLYYDIIFSMRELCHFSIQNLITSWAVTVVLLLKISSWCTDHQFFFHLVFAVLK